VPVSLALSTAQGKFRRVKEPLMNNSRYAPLQLSGRAVRFIILSLLLLTAAISAAAQSTEAESPTPISSNEVRGVITPRDVGDPRLTRYFYALTGTPGDLVITVESKNLNGDVDLFIAGSLRPVAKVSMYAGELLTNTSKSIYLRQRESFILRVEARTPNDDEGNYRIRFGGAFEPLPVAETSKPETETPTVSTSTSRDKNVRRVTSVGGRIDEPVTETATTENPSAPEPAPPTTEPAPETSQPAEPEPATTESTTTARTRRGRARRGRERPPTTSPDTTTPAEPGESEAAASQLEAGPRLIIETKDGMRVERFMSTVRRVTVENGQIVIVTKDGKVERQPMINVLRMAIEQ
jgi:hypothetical protein